jgi:hypothetical protein
MSIEIRQTVGTGINVTIRADKQKEAVEAAAFFGDLPTKCGKCGCSNLTFTVRRPETFVYYGLKCKDCLAEFQFGQYKDQSGLFPKFNEGWKTYQERMADQSGGDDSQQRGGYGGQQRGNAPANRQPQGGGRQPARPQGGSGNPGDDDDIPF